MDFAVSTKKSSNTKGGRPRSFDRNDAVATAMMLFRQHGFEGVSIAMLTNAMGIAPPSLYAAFGSKADLFREALSRYALENPVSLIQSQSKPATTLAGAADEMFERLIQAVTNGSGQPGCIVSTGMLGCHPDHDELADELKGRRLALRDQLSEEVGQWLPPEATLSTASFLCAVMQGIAVQARDGADAAHLRQIVEAAHRSLSLDSLEKQHQAATFS